MSACLSLRDKLLQNHKRVFFFFFEITEKKGNRDFSQVGFSLPKKSQHAPEMVASCLGVSAPLILSLLPHVSLHAFTVFVCSYQPDLTGEFTRICTKINVMLLCMMSTKKTTTT